MHRAAIETQLELQAARTRSACSSSWKTQLRVTDDSDLRQQPCEQSIESYP